MTTQSTSATPSVDMAVLDNLERHVNAHLPTVRSILVAKDDQLAYERYFAGADPHLRTSIFSCTKSVLSALVGMLIAQGDFPDLDDAVVDHLPSLPVRADKSFLRITVRQCLNMTIGYDIDFGIYDVDRVATWPATFPPGSTFHYNDVGPQIISRIVSARTGLPAGSLANSTLFAALDIDRPPWGADHHGDSVGGYGLRLTPWEMLTFGLFALGGGVWQGKRLVDASFFAQSTRRQSDGGFPGQNRYGFLWWVSHRGGYRSYYALGYGGQLICVCPDVQTVAVITCTDELGPHIAPVQDLYFDHIIPACSR